MDITVVLQAFAKTHVLVDPAKEARRYRRGDVVEVFLRTEVPEPPSPNGKFVFLHVTDVPDTNPFEQVKNKIMQTVDDPVLVDGEYEIWRRRKFRVLVDTLPQAVIDILIADREITVTWTKVKEYIRKKIVTDPLDQTQDDETTFITDADLS